MPDTYGRYIKLHPIPIHEPKMQCPFCGTFWGSNASPRGCAHSTCLLCGAVVCQTHGLGSGHCPICYVGRLSGWSLGSLSRKCQRAHCGGDAVADVRRRAVCKAHAGEWRQNLDGWKWLEETRP